MQAKQPLISYSTRDETGSVSVIKFHVLGSVDRDSGRAAATALRPKIGALTGVSIERQGLVFPFVEVDPTPAGPGSIHRVGVFVFSTSEPGQYAIVELPGLDDSHLVTTGPGAGLLVDVEDPAVVAFVDYIISGLWCNPFGYDIAALEAAFLQLREE